jgi:hypothetical protein
LLEVLHFIITGSDLGFKNEGTQDYHPAGGSDFIDAGVGLHADVLPDHDLAGQYVKHQGREPRPSDAILDIGAFELSGSSCTSDVDADGDVDGKDLADFAAVFDASRDDCLK